MQQKRLKITSEMVDQVSSDYRLANHQFTNIQQALQEDLNDKLSKNIGLPFIDCSNDNDRGDMFNLSAIDSMVTKGNTFVQLYFVTDDITGAKGRAGYLSPHDLNLLRMFRIGEISARELYMKLETQEFDLFVRRFFVVLDLKSVVDIYNSDDAYIDLEDSIFKIHK